MPVFGPGTLKIGATGTEIDVSCLVNSLKITASKDEGDSTTKLCGTVKPGKITYTYSMEGNLDVDSETADGLFALSQASPGSQQPFVFVPNTAATTGATGTLIIDPLDFGGEEFGDDMTSDIEFTLVGAPTYDYPTPAALAGQPSRFAPLVVNGKNAPATVAGAKPAAPVKPTGSADEPDDGSVDAGEPELATSAKK
jgi:hypothetical protein